VRDLLQKVKAKYNPHAELKVRGNGQYINYWSQFWFWCGNGQLAGG
tara:strand:+ start:613 stop:750 length:138 start_codon:yes stop_codon:yes gene_type:complete